MESFFQQGRPTVQSLTSIYRIRPPLLYCRLMEWIYDYAKGDADEAESLHWRLLGLRISPLSLWDSTPRELFAIDDIDGAHVGFIVHAPELDQDDYPWVLYRNGTGEIESLGRTTDDYLSRSWSSQLHEKSEHAELILAAAEACGVQVDAEQGEKYCTYGIYSYYRYGDEPEKVEPIIVPNAWWFAFTEDEVGVLAPDALFYEGPSGFDLAEVSTCSDIEDAAMQAIKDGYPGTAQVYARKVLPSHRANEVIVKSYRMMGREILAKRHEEYPI